MTKADVFSNIAAQFSILLRIACDYVMKNDAERLVSVAAKRQNRKNLRVTACARRMRVLFRGKGTAGRIERSSRRIFCFYFRSLGRHASPTPEVSTFEIFALRRD